MHRAAMSTASSKWGPSDRSVFFFMIGVPGSESDVGDGGIFIHEKAPPGSGGVDSSKRVRRFERPHARWQQGCFRPQARASRLQWGASHACVAVVARTRLGLQNTTPRRSARWWGVLLTGCHATRGRVDSALAGYLPGCEDLCQVLCVDHPVTVDVGGQAPASMMPNSAIASRASSAS